MSMNIRRLPNYEHKINDELLRRVDALERKVLDLQNRNQKLEDIIRNSFLSFKFDQEETKVDEIETEEMMRMRMISRILSR